MNLTDVDHGVAVLRAAGIEVEPALFAFWSKPQREEALVFADAVMLGQPFERPVFLPKEYDYGSTRVTLASAVGHKVERVLVKSDDEAHLVCETGTIAIRLDGD